MNFRPFHQAVLTIIVSTIIIAVKFGLLALGPLVSSSSVPTAAASASASPAPVTTWRGRWKQRVILQAHVSYSDMVSTDAKPAGQWWVHYGQTQKHTYITNKDKTLFLFNHFIQSFRAKSHGRQMTKTMLYGVNLKHWLLFSLCSVRKRRCH